MAPRPADASASGPVQRLFFALWPDEVLRAQIHRETGAAVRDAGGRPVAPENYHVTLKFLGSVDAARREALCAAADRLRAPAFEFALDRIGCWPKPRILWLGAADIPAPLAALAQGLERVAIAQGIAAETRAYRAHVTLARKVNRPGLLEPVEPLRWCAAAFALAASETAPGGARYRVLQSWPLEPLCGHAGPPEL